ncbi:hypothetical protein L6R53_28730 [Myxococcota bacterium]|nr:hypothetical protein [Myxococcota bacterium]
MTASSAPPDGADWLWIDGVQAMAPFLVALASADDVWAFAASNGGITAGRQSPERALFAYTTQDKLFDRAHVTGPLSRLRVLGPDGRTVLWRALHPDARDLPRRLGKRRDGSELCWEETHPGLGLRLRATLGTSRRFGLVRRCTLENLGGSPVDLDLLDGWQDVQAPGLDDDFLARFGNLADAYKRVEHLPDTGLRLVYLSSLPTDRAEPSESLRCNVVWVAGLPGATALVRSRQVAAFEDGVFEDGAVPQGEDEARGERPACLSALRLRLPGGGAHTWYTVGDVGLSTANASFLQYWLRRHDDDARAAALETELERTRAELGQMVAAADGLQLSADDRRTARHQSNVLFNLMRGGVPVDGHHVSREAWTAHLQHFDRDAVERHAAWLSSLPRRIAVPALIAAAADQGDPTLRRLAAELLPLTFSRRHGDPSRPWNRFEIRVRDEQGRPRLAWQGNWRDIFQNWEALFHSFPEFLESAITRFLDASTADGHNPYRLTSEGFDWERPEPDQPWSNIGYWGDHQVVYLLRLLEASLRFHPGRLDALLDQDLFTYARVPYRIVPFDELLADPRSSIRYDHAAEAEIAARQAERGADGSLLWGPDGRVLHVSLLEKLLVVLLARMAAFVPQGGIWMHTQRPEWNDANNALAGYGLSVVTMAHAHRYAALLLSWWADQPAERTIPVSREVAALLVGQAQVLADPPTGRREALERLGRPASDWRGSLYEQGLSGERTALSFGQVRAWLSAARSALASSLRANRRPDGLFHGYNLLRLSEGEAAIDRLPLMLEGQVAVLSAGLLTAGEALSVATALRQSALYRADQDSYLLYPDRDLPRFLDKNRIPRSAIAASTLLLALGAELHQDIVEVDADGGLRFHGGLRNGAALRERLAALPPRWQPLVQAEGEALVALFEQIFDHRAFTGRSGTFFAYEGLGSIYWHMVSKLALALQEQALAAARGAAPAEVASGLADAWRAVWEGLGVHREPSRYGAFPTDAYSHTPRHAGAQQPGMTGQVKEDILGRWGELGVRVEAGRLAFRPVLLRSAELLPQGGAFACLDVDGKPETVEVPAGGLAFTFCQVPVVYRAERGPALRVHLADGQRLHLAGDTLSAELSAEVFGRTGRVRRIEVDLPPSGLRGA